MKVIRIGRSPDNDIVIEGDSKVSRHHLLIHQDDNGEYVVMDDSKNGTYVGSQYLHHQSMKLFGQEKIRIGDTDLPWRDYFKDNRYEDSPENNPQTGTSEQQENDIESEINLALSCISFVDDGIRYEIVFGSTEQETEYYIQEYKKHTALLKAVCNRLQSLNSCGNAFSGNVVPTLKSVCSNNQSRYSAIFDKYYETAVCSSDKWRRIEGRGDVPASSVVLGRRHCVYDFSGEKFVFEEKFFVDILGDRNLVVRYNDDTKQKALDIVNTITARFLAAAAPGNISVAAIDAFEMDGTSDVFKYLNRNLFKILVKRDEIRRHFVETEDRIGNIIQNMLLGPIKSLYDYNRLKGNKEPYHIIVIEDFPVGIDGESMLHLKHIMKNGVRAGVNVILMVNEDKISYSEDTQKIYNNMHVDRMDGTCTVLNLADAVNNDDFEILSEDCLCNIVQYVNSGVEVRKDEPILFADYLASEAEWWKRKSSKYIEIPFGVSADKRIQSLKITQESGRNSAVVIGIPGSGKSVFLHALICSAAASYSPEELNMYLIDFSGVEFNVYAAGDLPHARVIAPEAEREFGLSVLKELYEEGARRQDICRENDVSSIVDLKAKRPDLYMPRLLVIIDEFQKFFEIENDAISRESNAKIHTIIQEFRKFGINLILATQKLPSTSVLPKDLIANRIVFESSPADFSALISLQGNTKMPMLQTGECIYNSKSGSPYDNVRVRGFLVTKHDIDNLLQRMTRFEETRKYENHFDLRVFRGNELPDFAKRRINAGYEIPCENPIEVPVYFGESIAISESDVNAVLRKESSDNILIMGGEPHVAQRIAFYAICSTTSAYIDNAATYSILNFMRRDDVLGSELQDVFSEMPFDFQIISSQTDVLESLTAIRQEIDARRQDESIPQAHIYLTIFAFQLARMFDRGGRRGDDVSECGVLLDYILKNGPAVGVFTIMQCDNYDNLCRIGNPLSYFSYRIALQMNEGDSNKIMGSSVANRLFDFSRKSSVYRAYFRDNNRNVTIKFKPYK